MLGNLAINKGLMVANEGGQNDGSNYHMYDDATGGKINSQSEARGTPTIGYGFTNSVFPNAVFQSMPVVMTPEQCDAVFADVISRFQNWSVYFTNIANGQMKLSAHQIAVMYDIEWQWGGGGWGNRGMNKSVADTATLGGDWFQAFMSDSRYNYANRQNARMAYWNTADDPNTPSTPPTSGGSTSGTGTGTPQGGGSASETPKKQNKITLEDGTYYLRNNFLYDMTSSHGKIMTRTLDHFSINVIKKSTEGGGSSSSTNNNNNSNSGSQGNTSTGGGSSGGSTAGGGGQGNSAQIEAFINKLASIPLRSMYYAQVRPQPDLKTVPYADCSSFIGWGLSDILPEMWNGGYTNTATQNAFLRSRGCVIGEGTSLQQVVTDHQPKRGDILLMGDNSATGAGNNSHIVAFISNHETQDVGYTPCPNVEDVSVWYNSHGYYVLCRWA